MSAELRERMFDAVRALGYTTSRQTGEVIDVIEAVRAATPAQPTEVERWLPIETAPRDGTRILLANKAGTSEGGWLSDLDQGADWEGQIGMAGWWRADWTDWPNTHWQPLPTPPALSTEGGGNGH